VEVYEVLEFNPSLAATSVPFGDLYWFNISIQQNVFAKPNMFTLITNATWLVINWQNDTQINVSGIASVDGNFSVSLVVNNSYSMDWKNWTITVESQPPDSTWLYVVITGAITAIVLLTLLLNRGRNRRRVQIKLSRNGRVSSEIVESKKP
jgi:hypothetical protein